MISICIPIYNFDVKELVKALEIEIKQNKLPVNLILIDDFSDKKYKELNKPICQKHTYIELESNIGRARIRNLFLKYTSSPYLLFLDCDSKIKSSSFITTYLKYTNNAKVVCGGRVYPKEKPSKNKMLSWQYGVKQESKTAQERSKEPNSSFMTNNFLIKRKILDQIKFEENLSQYGHEDTLFGFALAQKKIKVLHIENPVLNGDIEDNVAFLHKTEQGIENLVIILKLIDYNQEFIQNVKLLDFYYQLKQKRLLFVLKTEKILLPFIKKRLEKGNVNLKAFNLYKLMYLNRCFGQKTL